MDPAFRSGTVPNVTSFSFKGIGPPSPLYITRDDVLFLFAGSNTGIETVSFNGRLLLAPQARGGQPDTAPPVDFAKISEQIAYIDFFTQQLVTANNRTPVIVAKALAEGYLLSLGASCVNATTRGQTFARAQINRGGVGSVNAVVPLFADYPTGNQPVGWPYGRVLNPIEGPGFLHSIQVANPAPGADWVLTMASGQRLKVRSLTATLTTSAAVASRNVRLIVDDAVNTVWITDASASVLAGVTEQFAATGTNVPTGVVTTIMNLVIPPDLFLAPAWRMRTVTGNIDVADQWSAIWLNVEEYLELF